MNLIDRRPPGYPRFSSEKIICTIAEEDDLWGPCIHFPKIYDVSLEFLLFAMFFKT